MFRAFLAALALAFGPHAVAADDFPNRPIRIVVPFAAGSATDTLGRLVADGLSKRLGQPVIVDAKPGAGTGVGAQSVQSSAADGYTVLLGTNATFALNDILYRKLAYDPSSFKFIGTTGAMPSFLIVSGTSKVRTLADFVQMAKDKRSQVTYASSGVGSTGDMVGKLLASVAGVDLLHVPFKDGPQALAAVVSGEVDSIFYTSIAAMPLIKAGKVRPIAVSTDKRTLELPDIPTIAESGYPGFNMSGWTVLAVPKNVPADAASKLQRALDSLWSDAAFVRKTEAMGLVTQKLEGRALDDFVQKDRARMAELAKKANIQPE